MGLLLSYVLSFSLSPLCLSSPLTVFGVAVQVRGVWVLLGCVQARCVAGGCFFPSQQLGGSTSSSLPAVIGLLLIGGTGQTMRCSLIPGHAC